MKLHLLLIGFFLITYMGQAQTTAIPDANFEQALIDLGYDTNGLNGNILNTDAEAVTGSIPIYSNKNISDLTGIEAFINLTALSIFANILTTLDLSNNPLLTIVELNGNDLTSINLSNNTALSELNLGSNQLSTLDLSNNTALTLLIVSDNQLESLNVKNGNNVNFTTFKASNNPNLLCIQVDDAPYSTTNWTNIDAASSFNIDCIVSTATTAIPDANFEQALIDLGIDSNGLNGNILNTDAQSVTTYLDVLNKSISDLTGIEAFTNITALYCNYNNLTTLDLSNNTLITELNCGYNSNLASLDVSNCTAMDILSSYGTNLTSLNLSNCTILTQLNLGGNNFSNIDLSNNTTLTQLRIPVNQLTNIDLSNNTSLTLLTADDNEITSLDLSQHTQLAHLSVKSNQLTNLNVRNSNNSNFTTFDAKFNPNLVCIQVDDVTYSTTNWTNIDAASSFSIDCIVSTATTAIPDANFEQALIDLDIDTNGLNGNILNADAAAVMGTLDVSSKNITDLNGIAAFTSITTLYCTNNLLTSLDISNNTALTDLDCSTNLITSIDVSNNPELVTFFCFNNDITNLDLSNNPLLTLLNAYSNQLSNITFSANPILDWISVSDNLLTSLDLSQAPTLAYLNCFGNQLESLNVKNGNNVNFTIFDASSNPNLLCIQVDNAAYSTTNWTQIDAGVSFSVDCQYDDDGDGVTNDQEVTDSTDPSDGCSYLTASQVIGNVTSAWSDLDCDGDGVTNGTEIADTSSPLDGCNFFTASQIINNVSESWNLDDCDQDGVTNGNEISDGTEPRDYCDYLVSSQIIANVTSWWNGLDCDGDGVSNGEEITDNTDPQNGCSYLVTSQIIANVSPGWNLQDCDCDAITNGDEIINGTNVIVLPPTAASSQNFCPDNTPTVAELVATGSGILWYASNIGGAALTSTDALIDATIYYASQTVSSCESPRFGVTVSISFPSAPSGAASQYFCPTDNPTVADLAATGTAIQWYTAATGGSALTTNLALADATTYYASQSVGSCESDRLKVTVSISLPSIPTAATMQNFCPDDNPTIANLSATGTNIKWYAAATGGLALVSSTVLSNGNYYASQIINSCESARLKVTVAITTASVPTGEDIQSFCADNTSTIADLDVTGIDIKWYDAVTGGTALATTTALTNTNTYYASQTLNGCESNRFKVMISINEIVAPTGNATQSFCKKQNPTISDLIASGDNLQWYATTTGGTPLASTTSLENTVAYYGSATSNGCESERFKVTVTVIEATPPTGEALQVFCFEDAPTVASLVATGENLEWYDNAADGTSIDLTTALTSTTYYVQQSINGCVSSRLEVVVEIDNPIIDSSDADMIFNETRTLSGTPEGGVFTIASGLATLTENELTTTGVGLIEISYTYRNVCATTQSITVVSSDADGDGVPDDVEAMDDTDLNDGCSYSFTSQVIIDASSGWNAQDCDGDGVSNGNEVADGTDPLDLCSYNENSQTLAPSDSWKAADCDDDGINNGDSVLGIYQADLSSLTLYPSPTTGNLTIELGSNFKNVTVGVRDIIGNEITRRTYSNTNKISLGINSPKGIYFVQVLIPEGESKIFRILKN